MPLPDKKKKATVDLVTFKITCRVPRKDWEGTQRLGFKDSDLPGMVEGMLHDLGGGR